MIQEFTTFRYPIISRPAEMRHGMTSQRARKLISRGETSEPEMSGLQSAMKRTSSSPKPRGIYAWLRLNRSDAKRAPNQVASPDFLRESSPRERSTLTQAGNQRAKIVPSRYISHIALFSRELACSPLSNRESYRAGIRCPEQKIAFRKTAAAAAAATVS